MLTLQNIRLLDLYGLKASSNKEARELINKEAEKRSQELINKHLQN